jgi:hypothetical protein
MTHPHTPNPHSGETLAALLDALPPQVLAAVVIDVLSGQGAHVGDVAVQVAAIVRRLHVRRVIPTGLPTAFADLPHMPLLSCGCLAHEVDAAGHYHR